MHSGYVANKLALWKEEGVKRLSRILTKMGSVFSMFLPSHCQLLTRRVSSLSIQQSQQSYIYMNAALRDKLPDQLEAIAPESGLVELVYPSFTKSFGNEMPRTCAADVLAGVGALLEAARGVKVTVEVEGGKGGGELFGSERLWDLKKDSSGKGKDKPKPSRQSLGNSAADEEDGDDGEGDGSLVVDGQKVWIHNFWAAYDALGNK